mmetsp:Transcript_63048/g.148495  ORF Transcript_63048/g.148495 Transcript_63048/m.148495 type:complete len:347 (+) Transcript_63048:499-1539(+)
MREPVVWHLGSVLALDGLDLRVREHGPREPLVDVTARRAEACAEAVVALGGEHGRHEDAPEDEPHVVDVVLGPLQLVDEPLRGAVLDVARGLAPVVADHWGVAHHSRRAKVDEQHLVLRHNQVLRLDVPVCDPCFLKLGTARQQLPGSLVDEPPQVFRVRVVVVQPQSIRERLQTAGLMARLEQVLERLDSADMLPEEPLAALLLDGAEIGRDDLGADGGAAVVDVRLHLEEPRRGVEHCLAPLLPRLVHARRRRSLRVLHAFRRQHRVHRPCFRALRHRAHALSRTFHKDGFIDIAKGAGTKHVVHVHPHFVLFQLQSHAGSRKHLDNRRECLRVDVNHGKRQSG